MWYLVFGFAGETEMRLIFDVVEETKGLISFLILDIVLEILYNLEGYKKTEWSGRNLN